MLKLYHNPKCGTSRKALALLEEKDMRVEVVEYLKNPLSANQLNVLAQKIGNPKDLLRTKEELAKTLNLAGSNTETMIKAIAKNPILLNRPILESKTKAIAARPADLVLGLITDHS